MSRPFRILSALLGVLLLWACEKSTPRPQSSPTPEVHRRYFGRPADGTLHVYFLDVDQGDATLIISPTGETVLIDAGPPTAGTHLANRLPELLTRKLDWVIVTHPHLDHYGGLSAAVGSVGARRLVEPQLPNSPADYRALLGSLAAAGVEMVPAVSPAGEALRVPLGEDTELSVLWPRAPTTPLLAGEQGHELNSIVLKLTYKDTSVLLAGDAREQTEQKLLELQAPLEATLLKVGAHGSFISSSAAFLKAVSPGAAIISTGAGTPERAPAKDVLARLEGLKARVFRTDRDGEVHAVSNGQRFILSPQRRTPGVPFTPTEVPGRDPNPPPPPPDAPLPPEGALETAPPDAPPAPRPTKATGPRTSRPVEPASTRSARALETRGGAAPGSPRAMQFVAHRKTGRYFHRPQCGTLKQLDEDGRVTFSSRTEATEQGFLPAQDCKPQ